MPEQQNIEYKQSWHDDYLKWVCGFANAQGGKIFIGRDDNGNVVDLKDYRQLMDEIPNKIRNLMGITAEVNLLEENGNRYIGIIVPKYSVPISLRGRYYYRSGSVKQELTGTPLNEFLLKKSGRTWDDFVEKNALFKDIDERAIEIFLKDAENAGRLPNDENLSLPDLLEKLRLADNGRVKRAALIMFGKDPSKFFPNTFVKMGRFGDDDTDLKFQEIVEGNLVFLLQSILEQLNLKFFVKPIDFEGLQRIEKNEYPVAALREMILNALVHRNYMGAPTQIRIYDDKFSIWNEGFLPEGLSLESLKRQHPSRPRNPLIANTAFKGGYIDAWGRGTLKIIEACKAAKLPEPEMMERDGGFLVTIFKSRWTQDYLDKFGFNARQLQSIDYLKEHDSITNKEYQSMFEVTDRTALRDLSELTSKEILIKKGSKKGTHYTLN